MSVVLESDGWLTMETEVENTEGLRLWLRSLGASVEVLASAELRAEFRAEAVRLGDIYRGDGSDAALL